MANTQTKATTKYQEKIGLMAKSFKLKKELVERYKETCERLGVGQAATITKFMEKFIEENKEK